MQANTWNAPARTTRLEKRSDPASPLGTPAALSRELGSDKRIRSMHGLDVYSLTARDAPCIMEEVGRIRETEFRKEGGGTGRSPDLDRFDIGEVPYRQLVVWDGQQQEVVAAYRYILCRDALCFGSSPALATEALFEFSARFRGEYLPHSIELGRSVVNRHAKRRFQGLFAAWAGLGALVREHHALRSTRLTSRHTALHRCAWEGLALGDSGIIPWLDRRNLVRPVLVRRTGARDKTAARGGLRGDDMFIVAG